MKNAYLVWAAGCLGVFLYAGLSGWQYRAAPLMVLPADVRQSPGGYRSFHFWHSGWQGGK